MHACTASVRLMGGGESLTGFTGPEHLPEGPLKAPAAIHGSQVLREVLQQDPL